MIPVSPQLAAAIEAPERRPVARVNVDWEPGAPDVPLKDLSPFVESVTIDRAAAGELPDEVSLVEGAAAAAADLTLASPDANLAAVFNRANASSPLFGRELLSAPVTVDLGFQTSTGPEYVRRFTGLTRALHGADRAVRLKALDLKEHLSWPLTMPVAGRSHYGLNASWLLSQVVSMGGGPQRDWVVSPSADFATFRVRYHGSLYMEGGPRPDYTARMVGSARYPATTGTTAEDVTAEPTWIGGPFLTGIYAGPTSQGKTGAVVRSEFTHTGLHDYSNTRVEFWAKMRDLIAGENANHWLAAFVFNNTASNGLMAGLDYLGAIKFGKHTGNPDTPTVLHTGLTLPDDGQWHYVRIEWRTTGTGSATVITQIDGATQTVTVGGFPAPYPYTAPAARGYFRLPLAELNLTPSVHQNEQSTMWSQAGTINAVIDPSTLELDFVPDMGIRPAWVWLRELAAAEQAVVYVDEQGILRYRTAHRLTLPTAQTPVRTITAENSLLDLALDDAIDGVKTEVQVTATVRAFAANTSAVYTSSAVYALAPSEIAHLYCELSGEAVDVDTTAVVNRPADPSPDPAGTFVCLSFNANGAATGNPDDETLLGWMTPTITAENGGRLFGIRLENRTVKTLYVATAKNGVPTISLAGRAVAKTQVTISRVPRWTTGTHPVIRRHGLLTLNLPANPWVQRVTVAESLATRLLADLCKPVAVVRDLSIVADPRLQLGDRIRLQDHDGFALDGGYWISAIRDVFSTSQGYRQQITARRAATVLRWGTGRWGETTWGVST